MFGIVRYSFTIVATFCLAALCAERAFGQPGWHAHANGRDRIAQLRRRDLQPATGELWCIANERDELGDNTPFGSYGWPWYFSGGHEDPRHAGARPDRLPNSPYNQLFIMNM
jgi:hypothetical protein